MMVPRRQTSRGVGFDMTPMIDVVFQLIIFFLVSSHLSKQEAQTQLPLPVASSGKELTDETAPRITVNLHADGSVLLGAGMVTTAELQDRLAAKRESVGPGLEVRIRSDRSVPYKVVAPILLACAKAGIWNVTFAVYRPEDAHK
jgi:biopolymer transport protein ExbD